MQWSRNLAYAIGLITTDGNLSKDGYHLELTSKDIEQIQNFAKVLNLTNKIGTKTSSYNPKGIYYRIQFGDIKLYRFLLKIGLTPNKTKTISELKIPNKFFADFLRGHLDGDGYTTSFWDSAFKNSLRFYTGFVSASKSHLEWIRYKINILYGLNGALEVRPRPNSYQLKYAKKASILLFKKLYYKEGLPCLSRKRFKVEQALGIIDRTPGW